MEYLIIQVEEQRVTAARFGITKRSATLAGAASFALGGEQDLSSVAVRIAEGINGAPRVVLCLAPTLFANRPMKQPLTDLRKVREVLPAQLQGEMALPVEEAVFDLLPAAVGKILALWAKRADIAHAIDIFKTAGLEPHVVSAVPFAWSFLPGLGSDCVLCDGNAVAVIEEGRLTFVRAISGAEPGKQLGSTLSALELSGIKVPARLLLLGEQAGVLAAAEGLPLAAELLEMPNEQALLFRNNDTFQQLAGLFAVARASHAAALPDFRRGELACTTDDAKLRRKMALTATLVLVVVLLLFVSKGLQYRAALADLTSLNASIATIYREIFPTRAKAVDELAEIKGEIRKLAGVEISSSVMDLLKQLAEVKGSGVNGLYEAELEGLALRVKGDARSAQAVNEFKSSLTPLLATIELGEVRSRPDGMVTFTLTGALKEVKK